MLERKGFIEVEMKKDYSKNEAGNLVLLAHLTGLGWYNFDIETREIKHYWDDYVARLKIKRKELKGVTQLYKIEYTVSTYRQTYDLTHQHQVFHMDARSKEEAIKRGKQWKLHDAEKSTTENPYKFKLPEGFPDDMEKVLSVEESYNIKTCKTLPMESLFEEYPFQGYYPMDTIFKAYLDEKDKKPKKSS